MADTDEIPVGGRLHGLIGLGEFVEWEARHFFVRQRLSSKITKMVRPFYFVDEMVNGAFKSFWHKHKFIKHKSEEVLMIDDFRYEVPLGVLGQLANVLFLHKYMQKMLEVRSEKLKYALESELWKEYITCADSNEG